MVCWITMKIHSRRLILDIIRLVEGEVDESALASRILWLHCRSCCQLYRARYWIWWL